MRYCFSLFLLFSFIDLKAQLANTTWVGDFAIPGPMRCSFIFSSDTALVKLNETDDVLEMMSYRLSSDTLFLKKISGMSPCYDLEDAVYLFKVKDKKLMLTVVRDECDIRKEALPINGLEQVKP